MHRTEFSKDINAYLLSDLYNVVVTDIEDQTIALKYISIMIL